MAARPLRAGVVQQPLADGLPDRCRPVEADRIGLLDLAVRPQRRQPTLRMWWEISDSRSVRTGGLGGSGLASARGSRRTASQYSGGMASLGPGFGVLRVSLPTKAASFSICFGVGMRQLAGRSVIPRKEHIRNIESSPPKVRNWKMIPGTLTGAPSGGA